MIPGVRAAAVLTLTSEHVLAAPLSGGDQAARAAMDAAAFLAPKVLLAPLIEVDGQARVLLACSQSNA